MEMNTGDFCRRTNCRLCGSKNVEVGFTLDSIPWSERYGQTREEAMKIPAYPLDMYMCLDCGHAQQMGFLTAKDLWDDYTYSSSQSAGLVAHFERVAADVMKNHWIAEKGLIVDVGSNDGSLLRPFKEKGFRVLGIDPAKEIARKATEAGIETIPQVMSVELAREIRARNGVASVIFAFNAFAHCDDLKGMLEAIKVLMDENTVFVFEAQYLYDVIDKTLVATIFHEHMSHHSVKPMQRFLRDHYLNLIDVQRVPVQHGAIVGTAMIPVRGREANESVRELLDMENAYGLDKLDTIKAFGARIQKTKDTLQALVARWDSDGAVIAGYGAAHSGPTLISALGLRGKLSYVFDDHKMKVGKFTAGDGLEVLPTENLTRLMPDYTVILAWVHADKIIRENQAYLERGGKFVVLCPDFRIVERSATSESERLLMVANG